ncbi:MAG: hypothetical protein WCY93_11040 [Anaerolineaceae bacterium]
MSYYYEIDGPLPKKLSEDLLDKAFLFACEYLDLVNLEIVLSFEKLEDHQMGLTSFDEEEPISITIDKKLKPADMIRVLFHEMVHVKQYIEGHLEEGFNLKWMGEEWDGAYEDAPWEVEAFDLEEEMVTKWLLESN